jgi:hypothetical protein
MLRCQPHGILFDRDALLGGGDSPLPTLGTARVVARLICGLARRAEAGEQSENLGSPVVRGVALLAK